MRLSYFFLCSTLAFLLAFGTSRALADEAMDSGSITTDYAAPQTTIYSPRSTESALAPQPSKDVKGIQEEKVLEIQLENKIIQEEENTLHIIIISFSVLGSVLMIILLTLSVLLFYRKKRRKRNRAEAQRRNEGDEAAGDVADTLPSDNSSPDTGQPTEAILLERISPQGVAEEAEREMRTSVPLREPYFEEDPPDYEPSAPPFYLLPGTLHPLEQDYGEMEIHVRR
ncbi:uncharacterized protein VTP21DRAFT_7038 [Calcarisporiella thermophila]|uniref:uncharacterized protein n=1 Tax=Calcarisporiella thermophila TaxID=911321 RepID=UPI0037424444